MKKKLTLALLFLTATTVGCATLLRQAFQSPLVEFQNVKVRSIGLQSATIDVNLAIQNPNEYRIDAEKVSYNFFVDTSRVFNGEVTERLTLDQKGTVNLTLPVTFDYRALQTVMRYYLANGRLDYRVEGLFTLVTPVGRLTRPYTGSGRVEGMP